MTAASAWPAPGGIDRNDPLYRAAVRAAADGGGPVDPATLARLRNVLGRAVSTTVDATETGDAA